MHTENSITIRGNIETIFAMGSAVEHWPQLLPHYRWVQVLEDGPAERLVRMAAHRDGIPVSWTARQWLDRPRHRIHFTHVRGITRGMDVTWFLEQDGALVQVRIAHDLTLRWPLIGDFVGHYIVGEMFVKNIANKTLQTIKQHIEQVTNM